MDYWDALILGRRMLKYIALINQSIDHLFIRSSHPASISFLFVEIINKTIKQTTINPSITNHLLIPSSHQSTNWRFHLFIQTITQPKPIHQLLQKPFTQQNPWRHIYTVCPTVFRE